MLSAAIDGAAKIARLNAERIFMIAFMFTALEFVGAVRAQTHDVLEEDLLVGHVGARLVTRKLQPYAAELARAPVGHHRVARRVVRGEDRKIRRAERSRKAGASRIQPVIAIADPPHRDELIDALEIPARLRGCEPARLRRSTGGEITNLLAPEVFPLQLEVGVGRVVVRRPFQDSVQHPKTALAGEAVGFPGWILKGPVLGRSAQIRNPGLPRRTRSEVSPDVREHVARVDAVLVAPARRTRRKLPPAPDLHADVEIGVRGRHPLELYAGLVHRFA